MELRRIILLAGIGLTLMMLWQSWIEFQQQHGAPATATAPTQTGAPVVADDVPDAPTVVLSETDADDEVQITLAPTAENLINVSTDLMRAQIDPHGGDLVRVELLKHPVSVDAPQQPFVLMSRDTSANADLFVAQSGLIGRDRTYPNHATEYQASRHDYALTGDALEVPLEWRAPDGVLYRKIFRFRRDSYRVEVDFEVDNQSATTWRGFVYAQLKQTERKQPGSKGILGGLPSYNGAVIYTRADKFDKIDYDEIQDEDLNVTTEAGWVAMLQHYFVVAWLPQGAESYQFFTGVSGKQNPQYRVGYNTAQPNEIAAGQRGVIKTAMFVGPKEQQRLERQNVDGLKLTVDYGWLTPVASPLFWLLTKIQNLVHNWGWSIILLTVLVKLVFLPLSAASYKSMAKMKKLQPRLQTLKERHGGDKQKFQQEMMGLYKAEKVNPAGGCLPILVQIPVFIALYWVLLESVELRQAHFMFWLRDLSLPDPYFVLPLVMGASMLAQQYLNPAPMDPLQKKIMTAMPIVFTVFFLWFPAGLVLYWVVNNLLSIAQQFYITKKYERS